MHPVYDNIQDKITWFIQGAEKKYATKNFLHVSQKVLEISM